VKQRQEALERVKKKLFDRKSEMIEDLDLLTKDRVSDGQVQDSGDEALTLTLEKLNTSLEQTEIDELRLIDDAISRLDKGEYGFCVDCSEPISSKRLETFPYAARCIVCQEAAEE
jgi:DnaK suppressor protein